MSTNKCKEFLVEVVTRHPHLIYNLWRGENESSELALKTAKIKKEWVLEAEHEFDEFDFEYGAVVNDEFVEILNQETGRYELKPIDDIKIGRLFYLNNYDTSVGFSVYETFNGEILIGEGCGEF